MPGYLNVPQVAKLLGVNIQTVRAYIRSGELPAARIGRRYVLTEDDIDTFIRKRKETRKPEELGLTEKGKENVEKIRATGDRVLAYLEECPGGNLAEITGALGIDTEEETRRALLWLEGRGLATREQEGERSDKKRDTWSPKA